MIKKELWETFKTSPQAPIVRKMLVFLVCFYAAIGIWVTFSEEDQIKKSQADHLQRVEAAAKGAAAIREGK